MLCSIEGVVHDTCVFNPPHVPFLWPTTTTTIFRPMPSLHTSRTHFNDAKKPKIPNFAAAKHTEIARFLEVSKSKYVQCYLIFMFPSFTDQKVALTMLTYHDCSKSFSYHAICNYDVIYKE